MSLEPPLKVEQLQRTLHAKAKESPDYQFAVVGRTGGYARKKAPLVVVSEAQGAEGQTITHYPDKHLHFARPQRSVGDSMSPCPKAGCGKFARPV